jgi:hypothetical protein
MGVDDRQFRLVKLICFPLAAMLGAASSYLEWSVGYVYLAWFALVALMVAIGTHEPRERSRRR